MFLFSLDVKIASWNIFIGIEIGIYIFSHHVIYVMYCIVIYIYIYPPKNNCPTTTSMPVSFYFLDYFFLNTEMMVIVHLSFSVLVT